MRSAGGAVSMCVCFTWETSLWFSLNQVSLMAALRSKRLASCSSFSWRISSVLRASSRSCSAFSSRSQAYHNTAFSPLGGIASGGRIRVRGQGSRVRSGVRGQGQGSGSGVRVRAHLVDVRDELALAGGVHLLVVGPHPALDGEQKDLQVPLLCEPETTATTITIIITSSSPSSPSPP